MFFISVEVLVVCRFCYQDNESVNKYIVTNLAKFTLSYDIFVFLVMELVVRCYHYDVTVVTIHTFLIKLKFKAEELEMEPNHNSTYISF